MFREVAVRSSSYRNFYNKQVPIHSQPHVTFAFAAAKRQSEYAAELNSSTKKSCIVYSCIISLCIRVCIFVYLLNFFIFRVCIVYFANFLIVYSRVINIHINYSNFIFHVLFILKTVYVYYFCSTYEHTCT